MAGRDTSPGSHGERLGRAVKWLAEQGRDDQAVVGEACRRFDLSPADETALRRMWRERAAGREAGKRAG